MCQLIESIKVADGSFQNLPLHNARLNKARKDIWNCREEIDIVKSVSIPAEAITGTYKCRLIYIADIVSVEFLPYTLPKINSLKMVFCNAIDYAYKYADRSYLENLLLQKGECDDILIVKHDLITDTSFSNIAFYDGKKWLTPSTPLLKGTKREQLLQEGLLEEAEIGLNDLGKFSKASLINAILDIDDVIVGVRNIY